jgi:phospholipid-translocating ATPase
MLLSLFLFDSNLINIVGITFTALILTELLNVAFEVHKWNRYMIASEIVTMLIYFGSMAILSLQRVYFDITFIVTWDFIWRVSVVTLVACIPIYLVRFIRRRIDPPSYSKLS